MLASCKIAVLATVFILAFAACTNAPRVTIDAIPIYPDAIPFAQGEQPSASSIKFVTQQETALAQTFKWKGAHTQASFRLPRRVKPTEARSWYFRTLTEAGWRSVYSVAYAVYANGAGQYLAVYILASETTEEEYELLLTLNE